MESRGGGGVGSRENLAIITKDFEKKLSCFAKSGWHILCSFPYPVFFLQQTHFTFCLYFCCRSILETLLPHLEAEKTCAHRARDESADQWTKNRNVYMLLLLALFLFGFPNWTEIG